MKNFINFLFLTLLNQKGELNYEKYMDDANLESLGAEQSETSTSDDQLETESSESESEEANELSVEDQLSKLEVSESEFDESKFLESVNDLGILRKGLPVEVKDMEELKSMLSMGADYTFKSQEREKEFSERESAFTEKEEAFAQKEQEFEARIAELDNELTANKLMDDVLETIQRDDPELFQDIMAVVKNVAPRYNGGADSPVIKEMRGEIDGLKRQLTKQSETEVNQKVEEASQQWQEGLNSVRSEYNAKLKTLGVKPDWNKVNDVWSADENQSMTVKEAFFAVHGSEIQKAFESQQKLAKTKLESAKRVGDPSGNEDRVETTTKPMSYTDKALAIAQKLGV